MPRSFRCPVGRAAALALPVLLAVSRPGEARAAKVEFIHDFKGGSDGSNPASGLVAGPNGAVYGSTAASVFRLTRDITGKWHEKSIFSPGIVSLVGTATALYGLTQDGLSMLTPPAKGQSTWTLSTLYSFQANGDLTPSNIAIAPNGSFVGTTVEGGGATACGSNNGVPVGCGTVIRVAKDGGKWTETLLHAYQGGRDGELPLAAPAFDAAGNVFVSTEQGGSGAAASTPKSCTGVGTVEGILGTVLLFIVDLNCVQNTLDYLDSQVYIIHPTKAGGPAGRDPAPTKLPQDSAIIVTALGGGHPTECPDLENDGCGAVALYTQPANGATPWKLAILHRFSGTDGALPAGALTALGTDTLYGVAMTYGGKCTNVGYGFGGCGTIWKLVQGAKGWGWGGLVYKFPGGARGTNPVPYLLSYKGVLLGTTTNGGSTACGNPGCGTIFALTP